MTTKTNDTENQSVPAAAEPSVVYGRIAGNDERLIPTIHSHETKCNPAGRMSVDVYFEELWSMYQKKQGFAQ